MSVIGFDIGNFKSTIGVAKQGGIEIIANEFSDRITPSYVSFSNRERFQGHSAKQQEVTNFYNTVHCFKRFLGRNIHDPQVQQEMTYYPYRLSSNNEKASFDIEYMNEIKSYSCEQIMAMMLTKLKLTAETYLNTKVVDCVISVPSFMTDSERRAVLDAAQIAGLNCLKLMNETTAVALTYGLYQSNLPEPTEKSHIVAFVDIGFTQTQAYLVSFCKGKLKMLAVSYDSNLGGRDFDAILMDYFNQEFKTKYNLDAYSNPRAKLRLKAECEKLKKIMSSTSAVIPLNIECFMNDKDVSGKIKREDFEKLIDHLIARIRSLLHDLLLQSKLTTKDIDIVEIIGGSTRMPAIKSVISDVFGKESSTTLNADEACARGCTLMCAILSPTFKVKDFKIEDCQIFPITLNWKGAETDDNELEVFPKYDKIPMSKMLTIYKKEPFEIEARYRFPNNIPFNDPRIGKFYISNVIPNINGENSEIRIKARITKNGIFEISSPQMVELLETVQDENMEVDANSKSVNKDQLSQQSEGTNGKSLDTTNEENATVEDKNFAESNDSTQPNLVKKKKSKLIDLPLTSKVPQLTKVEINILQEQEYLMIQQDRKEKERSEAKNSLEEYIYEMRDKLCNEFEKFILPEDKTKFMKLLDENEEWLYNEDVDNLEKSIFVDKHSKLKQLGDPVRRRFKECDERSHIFEEFGKSIQQITKAINMFDANDEKYSHIDINEIEKVRKTVDDKHKWLDEKRFLISNSKFHEDPVVLCSEIKLEKEALEKTCWSILNKPKPKIEKPKETTNKVDNEASTPNNEHKVEENQNTQDKNAKNVDNMDVD